MGLLSVKPNSSVLYELRHADADVLVVEKPPGVVTQPGKGHDRDSLLNGLFAEYGRLLQNLGEDRGWGLLHRLDRGTSGLLLVALRIRAYEHLLDQFRRRQIKKLYWAIVAGHPRPVQGVIQQPIAEITGLRKKAVIKRGGQQAITAYRVLQSAQDVSLVEARPKTGRLHQIRLHMAWFGHPILGDDEYGKTARAIAVPRLCLHAAALTFNHPTTHRRVSVSSPWPADLAKSLRRLGLDPPKPEPAG